MRLRQSQRRERSNRASPRNVYCTGGVCTEGMFLLTIVCFLFSEQEVEHVRKEQLNFSFISDGL